MMKKQIKVEWCKNWILAQFRKLPSFANGFETYHFWDKAEKSGLYIKGTYGDDAPMSKAISELCEVEHVYTPEGKYAYCAFKLKKSA